MELADSTWVITGASRGLGKALARGLHAEGARLVLNGRSAGTLVAAAREVAGRPEPSRLRWVVGDVGRAETSAALAAAAEELGGADGVIHNAGVAGGGPRLWEQGEDEAAAVLGASLDGALHLVRAFVPGMLRRRRGVLVFLGSGAAVQNLEGVGAYCVAKAAEEHLARQVALEAPELVSFAWRPGVVDTGMQAELRSARGGAAPAVQRLFRGIERDGLLVSPEAAAADLLRRLRGDVRALGGRVVDARDP